jgi:hypothetical protein
MMENKETFVMFKSNIDVIKELPTDAEKLEMLYAIADYSMTGIIPEFKSLTCKLIFMSIRPNIDGANKRYTASFENVKKGGAPKGTTPWNKGKKKSEPKANPSEPSSNQLEPNANLYVSVSVSDDVYVSEDVDVYENVDVDAYVYEDDNVLITDVCNITGCVPFKSDYIEIKRKVLFQNGNLDEKILSIVGYFEDTFGKSPMSVQDIKNKLNSK